jgi:hypothetical protein
VIDIEWIPHALVGISLVTLPLPAVRSRSKVWGPGPRAIDLVQRVDQGTRCLSCAESHDQRPEPNRRHRHVDDEESIESPSATVDGSDLDTVVYASGQEFLDALRGRSGLPDPRLQMPADGLEIQRALAVAGYDSRRFITAHDEPGRAGAGRRAGAYLCNHSTTSCCSTRSRMC